MKWLDIFSRQNTIAKEGAARAVDEHANPHDVIAATIHQLEDDHEKLKHACEVVIANATTAQERLQRDLAKEKQLDLQGKAAFQAGHTDAANAIAQQLVAVRSMLEIEKPAYEKAKLQADQAQAKFAENGELLRAKIAEAKILDTEVDVAAADHNANQAMDDVTKMGNHASPGFDEIRDRVHASVAQEEAAAQLSSLDPNVGAIHEQHLINTAAADTVLAEWGAPAQVEAPPPIHRVRNENQEAKPATKSVSATDRLNQ